MIKVSELTSITTDEYHGTRIFVLGAAFPASIFIKRLQSGILQDSEEDINDYRLMSGSILPVTSIDTLFVISDELTALDIEKKYADIHTYHLTTMDATMGYGIPELYNDALIRLNETDWQALRNVERQFLAMHDAGIWILPDDVRLVMIEREALRADI